MKRLTEIEVEPLSDQRWSRIERSLMERVEADSNDASKRTVEPRRRLGGRAWLVAAALVGVVGAVTVGIVSMPQRAAVEQPSRITTGTTPSHLALSGLTLDVEPESAVVVGAETPQGMLIVVDRGSIVCEVAPRPSDAPLIVQAGAARVRVVGTRFSVARLGESARVKVTHGVVEVSASGHSTRVRAGEEWPADGTASAAPVSSPPEVEAQQNGADTNLAPPERAAASKVKSKSSPVVAAAPASPSPQQVFEQATVLERSDPTRASELYGTLESGAGSWAQNALYARGRLEASRGNRAEARLLLEQYLERFPNGTNAEDARAVLRRLR
jgi:hypothetical protein